MILIFKSLCNHTLHIYQQALSSHIGEKSRNSVLQDHLKGRYREVDFLNGLIVKKGIEAGIKTPTNKELVKLTNLIRNKEIKPSTENIYLIEDILKNY